FTEDEGKLRGVAKSAAKSRRRFGGKLERLSRVRVTYFEKETTDLARIDGLDLLEESFTLHQDLRVAAMLAYVAEVTDTFAHEHESDRRFFRLLKSLISAVRSLPAGGGTAGLLRYFEIWTLKLHGLMPDLDQCGLCGRALSRSGAWMTPSEGMFQATCRSCRPQARGGLVLSAAALAVLERFWKHAPTDLANVAFSPAALAEIESFAAVALTEFVGRPFRSARFLKELSLETAP
ncbi:MAG TPA: DNA repair protein RecO, partial [Candidatus Polarisedimenticolia bacterium]|nr:DNA repair protein RecO [Candidatus Polarisedimenticolia bacterium]